MSESLCRISHLAGTQHDVVAVWQLIALGERRRAVETAVRGLRRVYHGVYALNDLTEDGWLMATALALGPKAAISHLTALRLHGMRPWKPSDIDVTAPNINGRVERTGVRLHRTRGPLERTTVRNIPVVTPTRALLDAGLERHELYRAIENANRQWLPLDLPRLRESPSRKEVFHVYDNVKGTTKSDTEAAFLFLCHDHGIALPRVNHRLNRCEADFHWPDSQLVVEVDGYLHHREKPQFEEDRRRGVRHRITGYEVIRVSADQVYDEPDQVAEAIRSARNG
jgi:hypothetical protein